MSNSSIDFRQKRKFTKDNVGNLYDEIEKLSQSYRKASLFRAKTSLKLCANEGKPLFEPLTFQDMVNAECDDNFCKCPQQELQNNVVEFNEDEIFDHYEIPKNRTSRSRSLSKSKSKSRSKSRSKSKSK